MNPSMLKKNERVQSFKICNDNKSEQITKVLKLYWKCIVLKMNVLKMNNIQVTSKQNPSLAAPRLDSEWKFQKCHVKTIL